MTASARSQDIPFLPPAWAAMLKRSVITTCGVVVLTVIALLLTALATYAPTDPSLNTASTAAVQNALGKPGAIVADLVLQIAGLGIAAVVFAVSSWGLHLVRGEQVEWLWLRTLSALGAMIFVATALAGIPAPAIWPIDAGFGGSVGRVVMSLATFKNQYSVDRPQPKTHCCGFKRCAGWVVDVHGRHNQLRHNAERACNCDGWMLGRRERNWRGPLQVLCLFT